jgi:hypothetical protein
MDMTRFLIEPEWPTSWLLKIIADRIVAECASPEEADEVFEAALDVLIPRDRPGSSVW